MTRFRTDKEEPHGYLTDYLAVAKTIGPSGVVCEVGVWAGYSLEMWQELFPDGMVIGIDAKPDCIWPEGTIRIVADQAQSDLAGLVKEHAPDGCDLIVDDASHLASLTAATFRLLWPLVRPGGFYVIEDWADPWVDSGLQSWSEVGEQYALEDLVDYVPALIGALKHGASRVTYTREGLVILRREY